MCNRAFELIFNDKGYLGLQSKQAIKPASGKGRARQEIVLMAWRSPHATKEQNIWLEKKMKKAKIIEILIIAILVVILIKIRHITEIQIPTIRIKIAGIFYCFKKYDVRCETLQKRIL